MSRMQFSIRTLLAAVAVVGISAALWVAEPSWQVGAMQSLLLAWVFASAAILSVNSYGKAKAFWFGVAVECVWAILVSSIAAASTPMDGAGTFPEFLGWLPLFFIGMSVNFHGALAAMAFSPVVGLLCVLTHWLFIRSACPAEPRD